MIAAAVALSLTLAFIAESMTEYIFATPLELAKARWPILEKLGLLKYISLGVGLALAFAYRLDIFAAAFPEMPPVAPWIGVALTGLGIGRGSNYIHDLWSKYLKPDNA